MDLSAAELAHCLTNPEPAECGILTLESDLKEGARFVIQWVQEKAEALLEAESWSD